MNQYFVVKPTDKHRYKMVPGFKQETDSGGYRTYNEARKVENYHGGWVVKNYTQDDFNRDYEREEA